jgi:hypothetical protein
MSLIRPWVNQDAIQKLEEELSGILHQAVKLSLTLRCQRASWSVRHVVDVRSHDTEPTRNTPIFFDEAVMKDDDDDDDEQACKPQYRKLVEIVVSPSLFKRGNTGGEGFEFECCVEKAEVKCYWSPIPAIPRPISQALQRKGQ